MAALGRKYALAILASNRCLAISKKLAGVGHELPVAIFPTTRRWNGPLTRQRPLASALRFCTKERQLRGGRCRSIKKAGWELS